MATKSTALVPSRAQRGADFQVHIQRLIKKTAGATIEQIAAAEGVKVETVRKSIALAECYRESNSLEYANMAVGHIAVSLSPDVQQSLRSALHAKKTVKKFTRRNGQLFERSATVPDHETQLSAVGQYRGLIESIQPKGGKISVNATANAQASAAALSDANYQPGAEEKIDQIRRQLEEAVQKPRELATIKDDDADILEGDPSDVSADDSDSPEEESEPESAAEMSP